MSKKSLDMLGALLFVLCGTIGLAIVLTAGEPVNTWLGWTLIGTFTPIFVLGVALFLRATRGAV